MSDEHKILVVEDNDFVRMQIVNYLAELGCNIVEATEGEDALDKVSANDDIGMAIVDVRMEPMGGFDFIKTVRSYENKMPVVLVTGDQTPDLLEQAGKVGVAAVLMKPVEKERLVQTVKRTLRIRG